MKIAIVGAGICGLYLAWKLAKKGHEVTVFEKKERIGKEVCSGLFSERILDFIPACPVGNRRFSFGESQKLIENQIDYCLIHFPKKTIKVNFSKKFFVMNHFELDNLVASLAERAGAKIILNHPISSLKTLESFERIIGCDGANSIVRKSLGLSEPSYRLGIQGFIACPVASERVETWPQKSGFLWKIPRGTETEYGIIEKPNWAKKIFDKFLKENNLSLEGEKSAIIPQGLIIPKNSSVALCGDAMGLTKPWSGGGVIWGLMAADILLKNFPDFLKYRNEFKKVFLPKIILSKIATKTVYFLGFKMPWLLFKNYRIESDFLI